MPRVIERPALDEHDSAQRFEISDAFILGGYDYMIKAFEMLDVQENWSKMNPYILHVVGAVAHGLLNNQDKSADEQQAELTKNVDILLRKYSSEDYKVPRKDIIEALKKCGLVYEGGSVTFLEIEERNTLKEDTLKKDQATISLISRLSEHALGCSGCGAVAYIEPGERMADCSHCGTKLLPQEEAYSQTIADRSHLADCLPYPSLLKAQPGLEMLSNTTSNAFSLLSRIDRYSMNSYIKELGGNIIKEEQRPFVEQEFYEGLADRQRLMQAIIEIDDQSWNLVNGKDNYMSDGTNILLSVAHQDGTYSLLRAMNRNWQGRHDCVYIDITKLDSPPETLEELEYLTSNPTENDKYIANGDLAYDTEDYQSSPLADPENRLQLEKLLMNVPGDRVEAVSYLREQLAELGLSQWKDLIVAQELWFAEALKHKTQRVAELGADQTNPIREPLIKPAEAHEIDTEFYLDAIYSGEETLQEGMSINCGHCNSTLENFQSGVAFIDCEACGKFNDVVKTGRVSSETLGARSYEETAVPYEYFLELLAEQEGIDQENGDVDAVDPHKVVDIMMREELPLEDDDKNEALFQVINGLVKIMSSNTHLLTRFEYSGEYDRENGISLAISVPDKGSMSMPNGDLVNISPSLKGKVILIKVEDFDSARYSGSFSWCKIKTQVVDKEQMRDIETIEEWDDGIFDDPDPLRRDKSWLDHAGLSGRSIGSHTNKFTDSRLEETSSRFYELLEDAMLKVHRGADIEQLIKNQ